MRSVPLRRMLVPVIAGLFLTACPRPVKPPPPVIKEVPPPPPPLGDLLRLRDQAGATLRGKVSIRMENESFVGGKPKKGGKTARSFTLTEERTIDSADADGTQHVTARLLDVHGETEGLTPKEQKDVGALAEALQNIRIHFNRSARFEISDLVVEGVEKPLDPTRARIVAGSIYGAGRGPLLPEDRVKVGQSWQATAVLPLPGGGKNNLKVDYLYQKNDGSAATISFTGSSSGETMGAELLSEIKGQYRFDVEGGRLVAHVLDNQTTQGGESATGIVLRVHVEWEAQPASAVPAAPAPAAPAEQPAPSTP